MRVRYLDRILRMLYGKQKIKIIIYLQWVMFLMLVYFISFSEWR